MKNNIYLILNIALFPFRNIRFYNMDFNKKDLNQVIQNDILMRCNPTSLDQINLILKKYYPYLDKNDKSKGELDSKKIFDSYLGILSKYAKSLLSHRNGEMVYKYWKNADDDAFLGPYEVLDKVHVFSIISRLIPVDIIVAAYYADNNINDVYSLNHFYHYINLADAQLDDVLEQGVSENHIHASAAFNFTMLWELVMNNREDKIYLEKYKTGPYGIDLHLYEYLLIARILRLLIIKFLKYNYSGNTNIDNHDSGKRSFLNWLYEVSDEGYYEQLLSKIIDAKDELDISAEKIIEIFEKIKIDFNIIDDGKEKDVVFSIFSEYESVKTFGENILLHFAFQYIKSVKEIDPKSYTEFCNIFFKYISIKSEFYQDVTQPSLVSGLDFFRGYFSRGTRVLDKKMPVYYEVMLRSMFQNAYLKKIELRFAIHAKKDILKIEIKRLLESYKKILVEDYGANENVEVDFPRIGIVYHLIKQSDDVEKCWCIHDSDDDLTDGSLYYKKHQKEYIRLLNNMIELRDEIPYLSTFIVGIDAASLENATPVEVFAPVYNVARNSDRDKMITKDPHGEFTKTQSLFFTFHAGEDFRHINSGLRRIDEVIEHCKFHSGDRIGHAIALGTNIKEWVSRNPTVVIPRGEYLDNLLWIWGIYSRNANMNANAGFFIYLEKQINDKAREIYQCTNGLTAAILYNAYRNRFGLIEKSIKGDSIIDIEGNNRLENEFSFCCQINKSVNFIWDSEKLYHAHHCKCYLDKITEPIFVNTSGMEMEMTIEMQRYLLDKVSKEGIVIEANPTSNFAIGELGSIYENQLFSMNLPGDPKLENIMVSINSDDPLVFNTNISNEIAYLYYGALRKGIGKEAALHWIDKIRKTGMDTSFIKSNISNKEYMRRLDEVISFLNGN